MNLNQLLKFALTENEFNESIRNGYENVVGGLHLIAISQLACMRRFDVDHSPA